MKRKGTKKKTVSDLDMRSEYDFRDSLPNKYAKRYAAGTNLVLIDPDLFEVFRSQKAINKALRTCVPGSTSRRTTSTSRRIRRKTG